MAAIGANSSLGQRALTSADFYTPAMMQFDATSYYNKAYTTSGNKVTIVARFKSDTFTTAGRILSASYGSAGVNQRYQFYALNSDHATVTKRNKIGFHVVNTSGTVVCSLFSITDPVDGAEHTVFASFDGDTGAAQFYIDGVDADDTGNPDRVAPTTGTLESGAGNLGVGAFHTNGNPFGGQIGFFGHAETSSLTWSDFIDTGGNPKDIEDTLSTVWGATPLFWNEHGEMTNNQGSAGNMTANGTITVGRGGN